VCLEHLLYSLKEDSNKWTWIQYGLSLNIIKLYEGKGKNL
jgi:hypothetical protein